MKKYIYTAIVLIILILPVLIWPLYSNQDYEKRILKSMPDTLSTSFPEEFEEFFKDNYSLKAHFTTIYSYILLKVFDTSLNKKVLVGKDGYLFFNETYDDYINDHMKNVDMEKIAYILNLQREYLASKGIEFLFTVAPNKNSIYPNKMKDKYVKENQKGNLEMLEDALEKFPINYVDLKTPLFGQSLDNLVYFKYDSHWNTKGSLIAYKELMKETENILSNFKYIDFSISDETTNHRGDLDTMLLPTWNRKEKSYLVSPNPSYEAKKPINDFNSIFIETYNENAKHNILMFRDSFANSLIPLISNNFATSTYQRSIPYDYSRLESINYDIVLIEIVQRNLKLLKDNLPILPATSLSYHKNNIHIVENSKIYYDVKSKDEYYHIYGYYKSDNTDVFIPIYLSSNDRFYKTYPILNENIENRKYENSAFSCYIKKNYIDINNIIFYTDTD